MERRAALVLAVLALAGCESRPPPAANTPEQASAEPSATPPAAEPETPEPEPPKEPEIPGGGPDPLTLDAKYSTSVGSPTEGTLAGGVPVPLHGPGYRFSPIKDEGSRYGTVEMVQALVRAAQAVHAEMPGNPITFGDLAREHGGDIPGHASHRSGRDVDIYFYLLHEDDDTPFPAKAIPLDLEGKGVDFGDLTDPDDDVKVKIDLPRTWRFVQELLAGNDELAIGRMFVVEHIRSMLLEEAERQKAPKELVELFEDVTCQPKAPHDDHIHMRVFCSADDIEGGCQDTSPIFPWHAKAMKAAGVEIVIAKPSKKAKKKKTKGIAEAREEAGEMHEDVTAFLDRRAEWAKKPRVKRPYCR